MITLIDEYKKELSGVAGFADNTVQNYTSCILLYSEYAKKLGMDPIKSHGHHIQNWILQLKKSGLTPSRLQNHQCALKSFFTLCVKMNLIPKNPADPLPVIRRIKSERNKPISKDEAYRLLRCIDQGSFLGKRNFLIISLFWALGLRLNELISIKVIDFEPGHDPKQKIGLLRIHGKNKKQRALFVVDKLYDHMIAYCAHPESPKEKSMPLFPSMKNRTISGDQVQRIIRIYAQRANINERITPHVLRHSFATQMYHQNVPLSAIQAMMGHSKIDETAVYIHIDQKLQREALTAYNDHREAFMVSSDTFFQHMDAFVDYRKIIYEASDQTIKSNSADLKLFQDFIHGKQYEMIHGPAVMDFQYYLKKGRANCGGSINRKIFTLRAYSNFLKLRSVPKAEELPFSDVLKIRGGYRNRPNALSHRKIKLFFDTIDRTTFLGIRDYAVYALMYLLGLRVGEVFRLHLRSIDFENNTITVVGKGNRRRTLHLTPEMVQVLSEWIAVRKRFCNSDQNNALFISKKGNRLAIRTMEDNFKKIVSKAALKTHFNITCHTMRHSFASHLNDEDVDILVIQGLMGHSSPRSAQAYIHPSQDKIRQALEKLPGVIYMNKLVTEGVFHLRFQSPSCPKRE